MRHRSDTLAGGLAAKTPSKRCGRLAGVIAAAMLTWLGAPASAQTYVATVATLNGGSYSGSSYISLGGYNSAGDGGGGMLVQGASGCSPNGGTIFKDSGTSCFYRYNPTNDLRQWGAYCDVAAVQATAASGNVVWNPTLGALVVKNTVLKPHKPVTGENIAVSQIGRPSVWATGTATANPAVTLTRWATLAATGVNYVAGDLIAFQGATTSGTFSQQAAIIVDAVDGNGAITQSHFLWGGLYDVTVALPDGPMSQDDTHSYCAHACGAGHAAGATLTPAWSGWSLLDSQPSFSGGSNYAIGDTITLGGAGASVNQSQNPVLIVENVSGGAVTAWDWLNYGSFSTLPTTPGSLAQTATSGIGSGFSLSSVEWTRGPLATTISNVAADSSDPTHLTDIFLTDGSDYTANLPILYFYYGHDDGMTINNALKVSVSTNFSVPAACGTTQAINLPDDMTANYLNAALVGQNFQSTGFYAFAQPLSHRGDIVGTPGYAPVLSRVIYKDPVNAFGGGFSNMLVEGLGIPEGYGYWGLFAGTTKPGGYGGGLGYVGPTASGTMPTAGDVVELDGGKYMRINNVHVENAQGVGNAVFQCSFDEADPSGLVNAGHVGNVTIVDSRFDGYGALSGATNPDFGMKLNTSCHDSVYRNLTVYDGTKADLLEYNGNLFKQIHVNSDAASSAGGNAGAVLWPANTRLAGVADYGIYAFGNTSLAQTQCNIVNFACVHTASNGQGNPGQITDTQMMCGSLASVSPTYYGVELTNGTVNTTISGTVAASKCNVPGSQLVHLDGAIDPSVSLCNNSNATIVACSGASSGFAANRYYTQPAFAYATFGLNGNRLYAVPFINASGGTITKIGAQVTMAGTATHCDLGIYSAISGAPGALLLDAGAITASSGMKMNTGRNLGLAANTLYFLVIGCDGTVTIQATGSSSGLMGVLAGLADFTTSSSTNLSVAWTYAANSLPALFGTPTYTASTVVPNVYIGP